MSPVFGSVVGTKKEGEGTVDLITFKTTKIRFYQGLKQEKSGRGDKGNSRE